MHIPIAAFHTRPAHVHHAVRVGGRVRHAVNLLTVTLAHVADEDVAGRGLDGDAVGIAQAFDDDAEVDAANQGAVQAERLREDLQQLAMEEVVVLRTKRSLQLLLTDVVAAVARHSWVGDVLVDGTIAGAQQQRAVARPLQVADAMRGADHTPADQHLLVVHKCMKIFPMTISNESSLFLPESDTSYSILVVRCTFRQTCCFWGLIRRSF